MSLRAPLILLAILLGAAPTHAQNSGTVVGAAAEAALAEAWPVVAARAEVRVVRLSPAVEAAATPIRVRFLSGPPRGRTSAVVEALSASGEWDRLGWAYLDVSHYGEVAVLTRDVARGETLAGAVRIEQRETTALHDAIDAETPLQGYVATRTLRAGAVLTDRLVAPPAAAEVGDRVAVTYTRGTLLLTVVGEARQRGALGDEVRVYVAETHSTFRVRLTGPGAGEWVATL